jgi:hypothetical protein
MAKRAHGVFCSGACRYKYWDKKHPRWDPLMGGAGINPPPTQPPV